jgi:PhnB protein
MSGVSTYLNFLGDTEEAFSFYREVFASEFAGPIVRMGEMEGPPGMPSLSEAEKGLVAHIELPILGGHMLMATDMLESMGHELHVGNNVTINLEIDTRAEADRLFAALSAEGGDQMSLRDMPWGAYWGTCLDRFGVRWMFSCTEPA